jgi:hypothetical protein
VDRNLDSPGRQRRRAIGHLERRRRRYGRQDDPGHAAASDKQRGRRILARRQPARELVAEISLLAAAPLENLRGGKLAANRHAENAANRTAVIVLNSSEQQRLEIVRRWGMARRGIAATPKTKTHNAHGKQRCGVDQALERAASESRT